MTKNLYIFSGLGADERVFQKIDFSGFSVKFIRWIVPLTNESMENYATRLLKQIKTPDPVFIGLSFGGMMAIEVAKQINVDKLILISSSKTSKEVPFYFRMVGLMGIHKLLPAAILKKSNSLTNWFFGTESNLDKQLLNNILMDTDPLFLKWAMEKIVHWSNHTQVKNTYHIHGENDRILPLNFIDCNETIKKGGHFMILNRAEELTLIIRQQLLML